MDAAAAAALVTGGGAILSAAWVTAAGALRRDAARHARWPSTATPCPWPGAHRVAAMETDIYGTVLSTSVLLHLDGCREGRASAASSAVWQLAEAEERRLLAMQAAFRPPTDIVAFPRDGWVDVDDVVTLDTDVYLGDRLAFRAGQQVRRRDWQAFEDAARTTELALRCDCDDAR